jgi:hypothetical protein
MLFVEFVEVAGG